MVDFSKKLKNRQIERPVNPLEIYKSLDRTSETGPLRQVQEKILSEWFTQRNDDKDIIVKLHTGDGKTLIGLLALQSKLNQLSEPCVFVCANIYLMQQACQEADKFGIPYCVILEDNDLPNDFLKGDKILITYIQKVFNGRTIFGIDGASTPVGCIVLDDSHACIDSIKNSFTIKLNNDPATPYSRIKGLFEDDLKAQGEGSYSDINRGRYDIFLPIPYWSWIDKKSQVLELLSAFQEDKSVFFCWPILKNNLENCQAFISGNYIEIVPYHIPIQRFGSFNDAKQRILMSATTQDDSFFIKGFSFTIDAVLNPLSIESQRWSGEKMLLIPSLIHDSLDCDLIVNKFARAATAGRNFGTVALVPSSKKAEQYAALGATVAENKTLFKLVTDLKRGGYEKTLVIVNRYDGIDLPDRACRILIIDSMPYFESLMDRYEVQCRSKGDIINIKMAQKIEQGLGRSVRGEKDYSVVIFIGPDLVKFIKSVRTSKFFSLQTQKQIEIGLDIAKSATEELKSGENELNVIVGLINQSTGRDSGWKQYYNDEMNNIKSSPSRDKNMYEILKLEREAEDWSFRGNNEKAAQLMQQLVDSINPDNQDRTWFIQSLARYTYFLSKSQSNQLQVSAYQKNLNLMKPREGITYKKIDYINDNRIKKIRDWIGQYSNFIELSLAVEGLLAELSFGGDSDKFEDALFELGLLLGFKSQRPDKEIKKGPDNLWCGGGNKYFLFECKNEVEEARKEINKYEAGQINSHCAWFESEYNDAQVTRILIAPTLQLTYAADLTHKVEIMRKGKLNSLKSNVKSFIKEFKNYNIHDLSDGKIQEWITTHQLEIDNLEKDYSEAPKKNPYKV